MSGENVIQSACMDCLAIYFREKGVEYRQLWTYANQQGDEANQFCGDLIGVIDDAVMFALEMKALDHSSGTLSAFKEDQFEEALEMQKNGIPIFYCYDNHSPLSYYTKPKPRDWPTRTLGEFNLSNPNLLDCKKPKRSAHISLLSWLKQQPANASVSPLARFAEFVGQIMPDKMRNGLVTVLYAKKHGQALALDPASAQTFYDYLLNNPGKPGSEIEQRVQSLLSGINLGKTRAAANGQPQNQIKPKKKPKI